MGTKLAAVLLLIGGCDTANAPDASVTDAGAADAASARDLDVQPTLPALTPCPSGWREVTGADGVTTCDPWPATGYDEHCAFDEAHAPGTPGCARVGTACATDGWPSDLPPGPVVVYVNDDAAPGGDGTTRARAFRSVAAGLAAARSGEVVAVATGYYVEGVAVGAGVTLWGACVSGTRVTVGMAAGAAEVVELPYSDAGLRNLGIDAPTARGVVTLGSRVTIDDVVVSGAVELGIYVAGGSATLTGVVVRDGRARTDGTAGGGIYVGFGAAAVVHRGVVERNRYIGVQVEAAGSTLSLHDCAIEGTLSDAAVGGFGRGIEVNAGAAAVLDSVAVERNRDVAVYVIDPGTTLQATDLVVRGTLGQTSDGTGGDAVDASDGAAAVLSRAMLAGNRDEGLIASGTGVTVDASDVVIEDTASDATTGLLGRGIDVEHGAVLTLARAVLDHDADIALFASDPGTLIHASDVRIADTQPQSADGRRGAGLWVQSSAQVDLTSARIERSHFVGVLAGGAGAVTLSHVLVSGVSPSACAMTTCPDYAGGFGLSAHFDGTLTASDFEVDGAALCGVLVGQDHTAETAVDLTAGVISGAPIGACVQVDGYDTSRLSHDVQYRDVGVPLQATSYTLPELVPTGA